MFGSSVVIVRWFVIDYLRLYVAYTHIHTHILSVCLSFRVPPSVTLLIKLKPVAHRQTRQNVTRRPPSCAGWTMSRPVVRCEVGFKHVTFAVLNVTIRAVAKWASAWVEFDIPLDTTYLFVSVVMNTVVFSGELLIEMPPPFLWRWPLNPSPWKPNHFVLRLW